MTTKSSRLGKSRNAANAPVMPPPEMYGPLRYASKVKADFDVPYRVPIEMTYGKIRQGQDQVITL